MVFNNTYKYKKQVKRIQITINRIMEFEEEIQSKLLMRGFTQKQLLNNRGLIMAVIDETILLQAKDLTIPVVSGTLILTLDDAEVFFNEILNPKEANDALKKVNKCH